MKENFNEFISCITDITNLRHLKAPSKEIVSASVQEAILQSYHRHEEYKAKDVKLLGDYIIKNSRYSEDRFFLVYQEYPDKYPKVAYLKNWFDFDRYIEDLIKRVFKDEEINSESIKIDFKLMLDDSLFIVLKDILNDRYYQELFLNVEVLYRSKKNERS
jgi:hypothetical protein